jgi:hypothetical protein
MLFWPWYARHTLGNIHSCLHQFAWLRPGASAIPFGLLSYWIERQWPATNLAMYGVQVAAILPTVILVAWYVCFDAADRKATEKDSLCLY